MNLCNVNFEETTNVNKGADLHTQANTHRQIYEDDFWI